VAHAPSILWFLLDYPYLMRGTNCETLHQPKQYVTASLLLLPLCPRPKCRPVPRHHILSTTTLLFTSRFHSYVRRQSDCFVCFKPCLVASELLYWCIWYNFVYFLNVLYEWRTLHAASILLYRYSLEYSSSRLSRLTSRIGCHFGFLSMDRLKMDVPRTCSSCKRDDEGLVLLDCNLAYGVTRLLPGRSGLWFSAWERSFRSFSKTSGST